tara:strand:+ start:116 stop:532 length:417 start_codon:yes stop_codon:yes gene_type:complete
MTIKDTPKGLPDSALDFPREAPESEYSDVIEYMEKTYPQMTSEFKKIQRDQYELFCRKQYDYGPQNIAVGTILKTADDIKLSLLGIWFRINDKVERIKTLLMRDGKNSVQDEPITDSFSDVSNYGVMAQVVARGKWAK